MFGRTPNDQFFDRTYGEISEIFDGLLLLLLMMMMMMMIKNIIW